MNKFILKLHLCISVAIVCIIMVSTFLHTSLTADMNYAQCCSQQYVLVYCWHEEPL